MTDQKYTTFSTHHVVMHGKDACERTVDLPSNFAVIMNCESSTCTHYVWAHILHRNLLRVKDLRKFGALQRYVAAVNTHINCDANRTICQKFCIFRGTCPDLDLSYATNEPKLHTENFGLGAMYAISHPNPNRVISTPLAHATTLSETIATLKSSTSQSSFNLVIVTACRSPCRSQVDVTGYPITDFDNWISHIFAPAGLADVVKTKEMGKNILIPQRLDVFYGNSNLYKIKIDNDEKRELETLVKSAIETATATVPGQRGVYLYKNDPSKLIRSAYRSAYKDGHQIQVNAIYDGRICILIGITPVCLPVDKTKFKCRFIELNGGVVQMPSALSQIKLSEVDEDTKDKLAIKIKLALQTSQHVVDDPTYPFVVIKVNVSSGIVLMSHSETVIKLSLDRDYLGKLFTPKRNQSSNMSTAQNRTLPSVPQSSPPPAPPTTITGHQFKPTPPAQAPARRHTRRNVKSAWTSTLSSVPPSTHPASPEVYVGADVLVLRQSGNMSKNLSESDKNDLINTIHAATAAHPLDPQKVYSVGAVYPDEGVVVVDHLVSSKVKVNKAALEELFPDAASQMGGVGRTRKTRFSHASTGQRDAATGRMLYSRAGVSALFVRRRKPDGTYRYMRCIPKKL